MFFLPCFKRSVRFTNIAPITIFAVNFVYDVSLSCVGLSSSEGNSCYKVLVGLLVTLVSNFRKGPVSGSFSLFMYRTTA